MLLLKKRVVWCFSQLKTSTLKIYQLKSSKFLVNEFVDWGLVGYVFFLNWMMRPWWFLLLQKEAGTSVGMDLNLTKEAREAFSLPTTEWI